MKKYRTQIGVVFVTAIVGLTVMLIVGTAFMALSLQRVRDASRALKAVHAIAMADAGVNYMLWNQKYPEESLSKIDDTNLLPANTAVGALTTATTTALRQSSPGEWPDGDQFASWLLKYTLPTSPAGALDGYQLIAKGTYRGYTRVLRVIVRAPAQIIDPNPPLNPPPPPVLDYALFSGTGLTISGSSTVHGDVGCNLDLSISSGAAHVYGKAMAGGRITTKDWGNISGTRSEHQPQVILSDIIQMANLLAYATAHGNDVYQGSLSFNGNQSVQNRVIYVKGDVTINANTQFSDIVTIVAEGNVTINGNVSSVGPADTSNLFIISPNSVKFKINGNANINATIIAPGVNASLIVNGSANLVGAVLANSVTGTGNMNIDYR
ncbi:MAG TPA: hypothetical protein VGL77_17750, partial [Armatimonadota bacterium]